MMFARFRAFWVPYLAFIAVCGACGAVGCGVLASVFGTGLGAFALWQGLQDGHVAASALEVAKAFPTFALVVAIFMAIGALVGVFLGSVAGLRGHERGRGGWIWASLWLVGAVMWQLRYRDNFFDFPHFFLAQGAVGLAVVVSIGVNAIVQKVMAKSTRDSRKREKAINAYFASTWLSNPPFWARQIGLFLPMTAILAIDIYYMQPILANNRAYWLRLNGFALYSNGQRLRMQEFDRQASQNCQANLQQIGLALAQYQQDYNGFFPPRATSPQTGVAWVIQPYLKSTQVFQCPGEFLPYGGGDPASGDFSDYWFNARFYGLQRSKLKTPTQSVVWGEGNIGDGKSRADYAISALPPSFVPATRHIELVNGPFPFYWKRMRQSGANIAFADGHVEWRYSGSVSNAPITTWGATMAP